MLGSIEMELITNGESSKVNLGRGDATKKIYAAKSSKGDNEITAFSYHKWWDDSGKLVADVDTSDCYPH